MHARASLGKWQLAQAEAELKYELPACALRPIIITVKNVVSRCLEQNAKPAEQVLISAVQLGVVVSYFAALQLRFSMAGDMRLAVTFT